MSYFKNKKIVMTDVSPMHSTPILKSKCNGEKKIFPPYLLIPCFMALVLFVLWQLYQMSFMRIFKSISAGCMLVYYSWELIYFDSLRPGIQPSSPLSPPLIRMCSGHILHLNYTLALMIGVFFTLFVGWFC